MDWTHRFRMLRADRLTWAKRPLWPHSAFARAQRPPTLRTHGPAGCQRREVRTSNADCLPGRTRLRRAPALTGERPDLQREREHGRAYGANAYAYEWGRMYYADYISLIFSLESTYTCVRPS